MTDFNYMIHTGMMHSLIPNIKTGTPWLDTSLSLMATALVSYLLINYKYIFFKLKKLHLYLPWSKHEYIRKIISYSDYDSNTGDWNEDITLTDCEMLPLINAIFYWLHKENFQLDSNEVILMVSNADKEMEAENEFQRLSNRNVVFIPQRGVRCKINDKLHIKFEYDIISNKEEKNKEITLTLYSTESEYIQNFVDNCWKQYLHETTKSHDNKQYLFELRDISTDRNRIDCARFDLDNDKTLDNVFIPERDAIKDLLDNFINKTGAFSTPFFPYKLGWILYGEPGCGKTSLIKAVANYTKRHIISVNLASIKTNRELKQLFFNPRIRPVEGGDTVKYKLDEIIYVIDDMDAVDNLTAKRIFKKGSGERHRRDSHNSHGSDDSNDSHSHSHSSRSSDNEPDFSELTQNIQKQVADATALAVANATIDVQQKTANSKKSKDNSDTINQQGLFDVLDGLLDSPGRIVFMTTNHIEKFDAALKRRVNQKLKFKKMTRVCMSQYLEAAFKIKLTEAQIAKLPDKKVTPVKVEDYCVEHYNQSIDFVIDQIISNHK